MTNWVIVSSWGTKNLVLSKVGRYCSRWYLSIMTYKKQISRISWFCIFLIDIKLACTKATNPPELWLEIWCESPQLHVFWWLLIKHQILKNNPHIVCLQVVSHEKALFTKAFPLFEWFGVLRLVERRHAVDSHSVYSPSSHDLSPR